ncbi:MAG: hypothetical protein RL685_7471, partial [Pseudomonadota bacterium]
MSNQSSTPRVFPHPMNLASLLGQEPQADAGLDITFGAAFSAQARETPASIALVHGGKTLSYRQLDEVTNRAARFLRQEGVKRGQLIGVFDHRGIEYVVAMLALLKLGAVYVPLDPSYPTERIAYMVGDAQLAGVVTSTVFQTRCEGLGCPVIVLDTRPSGFDQLSSDEIASDVSARDLMYVVYTSGSAGMPKGVMVEHRSAINLACAHQIHCYRKTNVGKVKRGALMTPFSFDVSIEQLLTLLFGHEIHILDTAVVK